MTSLSASYLTSLTWTGLLESAIRPSDSRHDPLLDRRHCRLRICRQRHCLAGSGKHRDDAAEDIVRYSSADDHDRGCDQRARMRQAGVFWTRAF